VSATAHSKGIDLLTSTERGKRSRYSQITSFLATHEGFDEQLEEHQGPSWFD
jgi:hypothetical protein